MNGRPAFNLRFGDFEFNQFSGELRRRGLRVRLTPQVRTLLRLLLSMPIRGHSREEIHEELWPGRAFMNLDHALNKVIHSVREALGDTGPNSRFIETLPRFGYRFFPEWLQSNFENEVPFDGANGYPIAVLPMQVSGTSPELLFAGGRITSALTDALSGMDGLRVRAERTVRHHLTKCSDPQRTGESMGVHAVLSGELALHDRELLVRMELIDVYDGAQLSAAETELSLPFEKHNEKKIVDQVMERMKPCLLTLTARKVAASLV